MSRPTDTERGALIAASIANTHLNAYFQPPLFPHRLTQEQFALWASILEAADETIAECAACRAVGHVQ